MENWSLQGLNTVNCTCIPSIVNQAAKYWYPSSIFFKIGESKEKILSRARNPHSNSLWQAFKCFNASSVVLTSAGGGSYPSSSPNTIKSKIITLIVPAWSWQERHSAFSLHLRCSVFLSNKVRTILVTYKQTCFQPMRLKQPESFKETSINELPSTDSEYVKYGWQMS